MLPRGVQTLPIVFAKGLDTKTDSHALQPPQLAVLENVVFDRVGTLRKRKGTTTLGASGPTTGARVLARFEDQLVQLGAGRIYSRGASDWRDEGAVPTVSAQTRVLAQAAASLGLGDTATSGSVTVHAWRSTVDNYVWARVVDSSTGAILVSDRQLSAGAGSGTAAVQVVAQGSYLAVFYATGTSLRAKSISTSSLTWSAEATLSGFGTVAGFSAAPGSGAADYIHLAARDTTSGQIKLGGIAPSSLTVTVAIVTFGSAYAAAAGVIGVCQQSTRVCVICEDSASELHAWVRLASDYSSSADSSNGGISSSIVKNGAICARSTSGGWLVWVTVVPNATQNDPRTHYVQALYVKTDATQNATTNLYRGCSVAAGGYAIASSDTGYAVIRKWTNEQSSYLVIDQDGTLVARVCGGRAIKMPTASTAQGLPHLSSAGGTVVQGLLTTLETSALGTDANAVTRLRLDTGFRPRPAAMKQGLFIPGGLPRVYTGSMVTEAGFLEWPERGADAGQVTAGAPPTQWAAATVYAVNTIRGPTTPNGLIYKVTSVSGTGTSAGSEPTWPTQLGATVTDNAGANQVVWTAIAYSLAARSNSQAYAVGAMMAPFGGNGFWYLCTVAGTSAGSAPTLTTTIGQTTTDGGVTWRCMGALPSVYAQTDGTKSYKVVYEWLDERGGLWRSAPSAAISVSISGYSGAGVALLSVRTLQLTNKTARIVVYRADSSGLYNQVASIPNDPSVGELRIVDAIGETPSTWAPTHAYSVGDRAAGTTLKGFEAYCSTAGTSSGSEPIWPTTLGATVTDGGATWTMQASQANLPELYTDAGEQPHGPPPACTLATPFAGRLAIAGLETEGQSFQLSMSPDGSAGDCFPPFDLAGLFTYPAGQAGGDITALAAFDGRLVCFKRTAIATVDGTPPDDSGFGGAISAPVALPTDTGALGAHGLVMDDSGVCFAGPRGIYRMTRAVNAEYIGAQVEGLGATIYGGAAQSSKTELRWASSAGVLVYNTLVGTWCVHTGFGNPVDVASFNDLAAYAIDSGAAVTEYATFADQAGASPVLMRLKTGQIAPAGPQAWHRFSRVLLTAAVEGSTTWNFVTNRDGITTTDQSYSVTIDTTDTGDGEPGSDATVRLDTLPQRARSIEIELQETSNTATEGLRLFAMTLLWAPWSPEQKVPSASQKG